tara:strand:+ start:855 stop:1064 length:210 start_codon:yes stop_codon:yes gene_type:complete
MGVNVTLVAWMISRRRLEERAAAVQPLQETPAGCVFLVLFGVAAFALFGAAADLALRLRRRDASAQEIL